MQDKYGRLEITNQEDGKVTILVDGVIGSSFFEEGVTLKALKQEVERAGAVKTIQVDINSPGGLMTEGLAIYTWLVQHPAFVVTNIIGSAASAATFIVQAGDERRMIANGEFMIHNARVMAAGDKNLMKKVVKILSQADDLIAMTYEARSKLAKKDIVKMMDAETYMTAEDAQRDGFIDTVVDIKRDAEPKNYSDYQEQIVALYEKWAETLEEAKVADNFDNEYRVAASLIPGWTKPEPKPYADTMFTTEPAKMAGFGNPVFAEGQVVNVNALRLSVSSGETTWKPLLDVFAKRDSANRKWLQTHKIEFVHNGQTYLYSEGDIKMFNQRIEELETEVESLKAQLEEANKSQGATNWDVKKVERLQASLDLMTTKLEEMEAERENEKTRQRDEEIEALVSKGYIKGAEKEKYQSLYDESPKAYKFMVEDLKKDAPRYAHLLGAPDGTTETENQSTEYGTAEAELVAKAMALQKEDPKLRYADAWEQVKTENTGLYEKYLEEQRN